MANDVHAEVSDNLHSILNVAIEAPFVPHALHSGVGLASAAIDMQLESEMPAYQNAPHVVYARGAADALVGSVVYPAAYAVIASGCARDLASCGVIASTTIGAADNVVSRAKQKAEGAVRAFDAYGQAANERVQAARQNGYQTIDDWPAIMQANQDTAAIMQKISDYFFDKQEPLNQGDDEEKPPENPKPNMWRMEKSTISYGGNGATNSGLMSEENSCTEMSASAAEEAEMQASDYQYMQGCKAENVQSTENTGKFFYNCKTPNGSLAGVWVVEDHDAQRVSRQIQTLPDGTNSTLTTIYQRCDQ